MYQTDRFSAIIMAIAMVVALPASIVGFELGSGLITIMFAFIAGYCLCYVMVHFFGPIQQKARNGVGNYSSSTSKPPGIMHKQARGQIKSRSSRMSGGIPFRMR